MTFRLSEGTDTEYGTLSEATRRAKSLAKQGSTEITVIHAETGVVAFVATHVSLERYFAPFERIELPKHPAPAFEGFVTAYVRKRIGATVYRGREEQGLKGTWRVYDGRTGGHVDVKNTKQANEVTKEMRRGRTL